MKRPLTLTFKDKSAMRIDMSPVTPANLRGKNLTEIKKIKLQSGNRRFELGSLFDASGSAASGAITIKRASPRLDFIGHAMDGGVIQVQGSAGDYLGREMSGGRISVSGSTGAWCGAGMEAAARIEIRKNAGDHLGGVLPGRAHGMKGGLIHVRGNVGVNAGEYMRRGMIAVGGGSGDYCGYQMLAGTIVVLGGAGVNTGFGMRRGSIILSDGNASIPPTFNRAGVFELGILRLILKQCAPLERRFKSLAKEQKLVEKFNGDLAAGGKGELLILL